MDTIKQRETDSSGNGPVFCVKVRVKGDLTGWVGDYFGGLKLDYNRDGSCRLVGKLPDSAAFYGLVLTLRDSGVELLSLKATKLAHGKI